MFDFHLVGKGGKWSDLPLLSPCGKWLLDRNKYRLIDLTSGEVAADLADAMKGISLKESSSIEETADGRVRVQKGYDEDVLRVEYAPLTGEISSGRVERGGTPECWEHEGETLGKSHYVSSNDGETCDLKIYVGERKVILVNTATKQVLADMTDVVAPFLDGTKEAESIMRGGGVELKVKHPGTKIASHTISHGMQSGPHVVISFKQNQFFWTGVHGELWLVHHHLETGETKAVVTSVAGLTEPENTVSVREVRPNGAVLFTTNGSYLFKDLLLYTPSQGVKSLLGKKDRFQGCQRVRRIPHDQEIQLLHHSKAGAHLIRFDNDGNELGRDKLDLPYLHDLSKEAYFEYVDAYQGYYYFNDTKEGGVAVHAETWKPVSYVSPKFTRLWMKETGWFMAEHRGRDYLGYLAVDKKPPAEFEAVCKLLGVTSKIANKPAAKPKNPECEDFLQSLKDIDFFKGYPDKLREKIEAKLLRNRKPHIIDKLQLTGIILDDTHMEEGRLSKLIEGTPYGIERVLYSLPGYAADQCDVKISRDGEKMKICYKRGAKELEVSDMDAEIHIEELLAFCDLVLATYKMPAKCYFVAKDGKATIICTQPEAMESLREAHELTVFAASRVISI